MAAWNYAACHARTLTYEGGYSNHPDDPGGPTLEGVTQAVYDRFRKQKGLPRRALSASMRRTDAWIAERSEIYRTLYWDAVCGDALPAGVDFAAYDFGVNSGVARANRDLAALRPAAPVETVKALCARRLGFVRRIGTFRVFGKGWTRRIADVEATGVRMALAAAGGEAGEMAGELRTQAAAAARRAKLNAGTAAGSVAAPASTQIQNAPHAVDMSVEPILLVLAATLVVGVAVYFVWRWFVHRERAAAYSNAADEVTP